MRSLFTRPASARLLLAAASFTVAAPALAQAPPSLSDTIHLASGDIWSEKSTPTVLGTPANSAASEVAIVPVAENESALLSVGAIDSTCNTCNGGGGGGAGSFYNRCGCDQPMFPYLTGPGNCDNWCVGPHWNVEVDGMALRRTGVDWGGVVALANGDGFATAMLDDFGYGPGARIFATAYNDSDFGLQIGYEGINNYNATALFIDPNGGVGPEDDDVRSFNYQTTFNSLEFNVMRRTTAPTKIFAGFRYVQVDEDFSDSITQAKTVPGAANPATTVAYADTRDLAKVENRMIGFQLGALRDAWAFNKWLTIEPFGNGGVYYNNYKREDLQDTVNTLVTGPDSATLALASSSSSFTQFGTSNNFSEISFLGEIGVTAVFRVNKCVAIRGGYQALVMDGVGTGIDAYFSPGLNGETVLYHGARFGVEYQR
ncbi:BBP7 family outer membrane beta-barrel protein [Lacipirellula sp.]|uniref:BBP7 family outer membrane beta-barrel protein n=1 Tax=Lacipirellula sp. TaxID=2691419 RepID=UPI003D096D64